MTMNSRCRSLFFSFTNAPVTGFPEASCTTPSMVELFSAARANWPLRHSIKAAKTAVKVDRVRLNVIPDLLIFLSPRVSGGQIIHVGSARIRNKRRSKCVFRPDYSRSIRQFRSRALTIFRRGLEGGD